MAVIQIPETKKFVIWSAIPQGKEFDEIIGTVATEKGIKVDELEVVAGIVPNRVHNMGAYGLKQKFPSCLIIGPNGTTDLPAGFKLDYEIKREQGDTILKGEEIHTDLKNFEFLMLNGHRNKDVITFDSHSKTIFESDFFFNLPKDGVNKDQYPNESQTSGLGGFISSGLNGSSFFGSYMMTKKLLKISDENKLCLQELCKWDFDSIVTSHGNVVDINGKDEIKKVFKAYL